MIDCGPPTWPPPRDNCATRNNLPLKNSSLRIELVTLVLIPLVNVRSLEGGGSLGRYNTNET